MYLEIVILDHVKNNYLWIKSDMENLKLSYITNEELINCKRFPIG